MLLVRDVVRIVSITLAEINLEISRGERKSERVKEPSWQKWNHSLILKPLLASLDGAVLIDFCVPIAFFYSFFFFLLFFSFVLSLSLTLTHSLSLSISLSLFLSFFLSLSPFFSSLVLLVFFLQLRSPSFPSFPLSSSLHSFTYSSLCFESMSIKNVRPIRSCRVSRRTEMAILFVRYLLFRKFIIIISSIFKKGV